MLVALLLHYFHTCTDPLGPSLFLRPAYVLQQPGLRNGKHPSHSLTPSQPIDMGLMADLRGSEVWYRFIYILLCGCVYDSLGILFMHRGASAP